MDTKARHKAAELASREIDRVGDQAATDEERAQRKRRLIKAPRISRAPWQEQKAKHLIVRGSEGGPWPRVTHRAVATPPAVIVAAVFAGALLS